MAAPKRHFTFTCANLPADTFEVVKFQGHERLSWLYSFEVLLVSQQKSINFTDVLDKPATLAMKRDDESVPVHGVVTSIEQLQEMDGWYFYEAKLSPKLWRLRPLLTCSIYLEKNVFQIVNAALQDGDLFPGDDYEFRIQQNYPTREFVCQYNESLYKFISRRLEREGIYFYFDHQGGAEKIVFMDTFVEHQPMPQGAQLKFLQTSGLDQSEMDAAVRVFTQSRRREPKSIRVKDYNYRTPLLDINGEEQASQIGQGEYYTYALHPQTPTEAKSMAKIQAQGVRCREQVFQGKGALPLMRAGYTFSLSLHPRSELNQEYLTTEVKHEGSQEGFLRSGLGVPLRSADESFFYRNSFSCIPAMTPYRPSLATPQPRITGVMHGRVDAAGGGKYAEVDNQGRYKVIFPFDLSGRKDGKASAFVRMAQPYVGKDHGMHFPLHKGTEVLLTFVDGDPDRPIISAAVPNPERPSQVNDATQTMCKVTTAGQNKIHIEDKEGSQRILMSTPNANTYIRGGAPNDPPAWSKGEGYVGWKLNTGQLFDVKAAVINTIVLPMPLYDDQGNGLLLPGEMSDNVLGWEHRQTLGVRTEILLGGCYKLVLGYEHVFRPIHAAVHAVKKKLGLNKSKATSQEAKTAEEKQVEALENTKLAKTKQKLAVQKSKTAMQKTRLAQNRTQLAQSKTELAESRMELADEKVDLAQQQTVLAEEKMQLAQEKVDLAQEDIRLVTEKTEIYESKTDAILEKTSLAESEDAVGDGAQDVGVEHMFL